MEARLEKVIAVVGHDGFLRVGICGKKFRNADFRIFDFESGEDELGLLEWQSTEENGGGLGTCSKGVFGWLPSDFKYMPSKSSEEVMQIDLAKTARLSSSEK